MIRSLAPGLLPLLLLLLAACGDDSIKPKVDGRRAFFGVAVNRRGGEPLLAEAYAELAQGGFQLSSTAASWGEIEQRNGAQDWSVLDRHFFPAYEDSIPLSITILLIDNQAVGSLPDDLGPIWLDDPFFRLRFCRFAQQVVTRRPDLVRYLWIGREVDAYFANNVLEVEPFIELVNACQDSVRRVAPLVEVGTTVSYGEAEEAGRLALCDQLAPAGTVFGLSVYGRDASYEQTMNANATADRLRAALDRYSSRPVIVTEIAYPFDSSNPGEQDRFVGRLVEVLGSPPHNLRGVFWESLHDWDGAVAEERANRLYGGEEIRRVNYVKQLRSQGLRSLDGSLRQAFLTARSWNRDEPR